MRYLKMLTLLVALGAGSARAVDMGFYANVQFWDANYGTPSATVGGAGNVKVAQGFTMGSSYEWDFSRVYLVLGGAVNNPTAEVSMYSNNAGSPGTLLATMTFASGIVHPVVTPQEDTFYDATTPFHLVANTSYWMVVSEASGGAGGAAFTWYSTQDNLNPPADMNSTGITYLGTKNFTSGTWSNSPSSLAMRMGGPGPVPVPEPGTTALSALAACVFAVAARHRKMKAQV